MQKGSVTVEAAIVLPVFLCVVLSITFLIKLVYTQELIQHALTETAQEMASASYIYNVSGLRDVHDTLRDDMQNRAEVFENHMDTVFDTFTGLGNLDDSMDEVRDAVGDVASDPVDELKNIACLIAGGEFNDTKTELFTPVVKLYMKKYLRTEGTTDVDKRLRALNIKDGFKGLEFSESNFFEDENGNIDIIVQYTVNLPVPVNVLPKLTIVQRASAKAWMEGDEPSGTGGAGEGGGDDIWSMDNFQRGSRIRGIFGANLPSSFPVIAKFEAGTAEMIKSMDLTAESYQNSGTVMETLDEYISGIAGYKGQENPWGSKGIIIREAEIKQKELLLVIPQNPVPPEIDQLLENYVRKAAAKGISLRLEKYGYKQTGGQPDGTGEEVSGR